MFRETPARTICWSLPSWMQSPGGGSAAAQAMRWRTRHGDEQGGQREHVHGGAGVAIRTGSGPTMPPRMQMRICRKQG
jgi:hypothetical protein